MKTARGRALRRVFTEKSDVLDVVERAICFFRDEGNAGERFADTIEHLRNVGKRRTLQLFLHVKKKSGKSTLLFVCYITVSLQLRLYRSRYAHRYYHFPK